MGEGTRRVRGLQVEVSAGDQDKIEAEFGDVLFSMINYARFFECKPEDALERTNKIY
jgi:XTP/dITP diphosphohydrolase